MIVDQPIENDGMAETILRCIFYLPNIGAKIIMIMQTFEWIVMNNII